MRPRPTAPSNGRKRTKSRPRPSSTASAKLPRLLILLTVVSGIVDAVSFLRLGHVFVANMTGNVVFLALAAGGAPGVDAFASVIAILAFLCGAKAGAACMARAGASRSLTVTYVTAVKCALMVLAVAFAALYPIDAGRPARYVLVVVLAAAMGAQNALAAGLAVPGLTTTVMTRTLTAIATGREHAARRIVSVAALFAGAAIGAAIVLRAGVADAVALAAAIVIAVGVGSRAWRGELDAEAPSPTRREPL